MLYCANLNSLASRREDLSRDFFNNIFDPASCLHSLLPPPRSRAITHGRRSRGDRGTRPPVPEFGAGGCPLQILSCCKILSTRLLALQCRKMCFLPLQQDFYSKSRHPSPQNSSQIYAYAITPRLRSQTFPKVHTRTQRYCSFIQYGLNHYQ